MRLVISWLRDFVDVKASAGQIAEKIGLRGFEVASVEDDVVDGVVDFEVTANRPDCLSVIGLAREVGTWPMSLDQIPSSVSYQADIPAGAPLFPADSLVITCFFGGGRQVLANAP